MVSKSSKLIIELSPEEMSELAITSASLLIFPADFVRAALLHVLEDLRYYDQTLAANEMAKNRLVMELRSQNDPKIKRIYGKKD